MYPADNSILSFASAYRQLRPAERVYVDGYVKDIESEAVRRNERISNALYRAIPVDVLEASRGMLERPMVRAAITERINDLAAASELTHQRVIKEISNIAFSSMGDYMTVGEDGIPYFDLAGCTPEQLAAIKQIEVEETIRGGKKFKLVLHDKLSAIDKLMRFMGLLENDNPVWRADQTRPNAAPLPNGITEQGAAERYALALNGG